MTYADKYANKHPDGGPTLAIVMARARAAITGRCGCGEVKDPTEVKRIGSRSWISCFRCLGQIKQLS